MSLLLLALQQTAASLSPAVFDQFLRRRHNQFFFGFFVGLSLFALATLATVNEPYNPVLAASVAVALTIVALFLLIVLLYTAINQMRPIEIVEEIHRHTLAARRRQEELLTATRRTSQLPGGPSHTVLAPWHGYVTHIDMNLLKRAIATTGGEVEVRLQVSIGSYVSTGDVVADVTCVRGLDIEPRRRCWARCVSSVSATW
ncbi:MAG: DUF2254 domain-containing protein [Gemmatimonadota bacterium]|nr:DUF2254 domain-containing protein [Gemmatimonadota bacterium]